MTKENEQNEEIYKDPFDIEPVKDPSATAKELLEKLDLAHDRWNSNSFWIFRGQNDARWELEPSLFRNWDEGTRSDYEINLIDNFIRTAKSRICQFRRILLAILAIRRMNPLQRNLRISLDQDMERNTISRM